MSDQNNNITKLLERRASLIEATERASAKSTELMGMVRSLLEGGGSTGDRQLDLSLLFSDSAKRADGEVYYELEQRLEQCPGELILLISSWESDMIKHCFDIGQGSPKITHHAYIVGVLYEDPKLLFGHGLELPVDRYVTIGSETPFWLKDSSETVTELRESGRGLSWSVRTSPGFFKKNLYLGNKCVIQQLDGLIAMEQDLRKLTEGDPLSKRVLSILGVEHFGEDGQGVLSVPKTES